jgi:hypothetical protein
MPYKIMTALFFFSLFFCLQRQKNQKRRRYNKTPKNAANSLNPFNLNLPDGVWQLLIILYDNREWRVLRTEMDS